MSRKRETDMPQHLPLSVCFAIVSALMLPVLAGCAGDGDKHGPATNGTTHASQETCSPTRKDPGPLVDLTVQPSRGKGFLTKAQIDTLLARAKHAGARVIGVPVDWRFIQPRSINGPHLGDLATVIREIHHGGFQLRLSVTGMPDWAFDTGSGGNFQPPRTISEFRRWQAFIRQLLSYASPVSYLEVWPNPNIDATWMPHANAAEFAELLKATGEVVRHEFPHTKIIAGGIRSNNTDYLMQVYKALGTRHPFDYVGVRLANDQVTVAPDDDAASRQSISFSGLKAMQSVTSTHGRSEPIYVTEFGYQVGSPGLSDSQRAAYLTKAFQIATCDHIWALSWYAFHPTPWDPPRWAIVRVNGKPTATYRALVSWSARRRAALGQSVPATKVRPGS